MNEQQLISMIIELKSWHQNRVEKCQMIIDEKDADIRLDMGESGSMEFGADTREARFIRIGVQLALLQFQPFPITMKQADDAEDDSDV
ncbi:TPA: hypothetical protein MOX26_003539 [Salmonella enterica subsp. enterica serovar Ball]|uniref:Phage protein n=4 Tax=Salmonella enterica TaxID=28901 RepID=A0A3U7QCI9_SALET|nr:hypothetical protein [Salmonella enterica]EAA5486967.1 hypothetical protein [Salmonella enterica subsp. enterica serovar Kouka]EBF9511091.1 hypothetical protein [Salmonella enterica subsp. enterica serovar Stanleyville]EBF9783530.1 hypothetical protein [Salmonella enterica subsp. enterica serovar Kiambu]EBO3011235.1 hypothetical protein [Salmonella enterica subsp. enterica serovar Newport]EBS2326011.1 hypothetical protein [Salmonella enterica subsp. enterica serovar Telelkebir]EBU9544413.1